MLVYIYRLFRSGRTAFFMLLFAFLVFIAFFASQISFVEDISQSVSGRDNKDNLGYVVKNLKISDKLIVDIALADSLAPVNPEGLESFGKRFVDSLNASFDKEYIRNITFRASDT